MRTDLGPGMLRGASQRRSSGVTVVPFRFHHSHLARPKLHLERMVSTEDPQAFCVGLCGQRMARTVRFNSHFSVAL